jgi:hypothetical protein
MAVKLKHPAGPFFHFAKKELQASQSKPVIGDIFGHKSLVEILDS